VRRSVLASELKNLSVACTKLWELDENRLVPEQDYKICLQQGKSPYQQGDMATDKLFTFVNPSVFQRRTFKLFKELLDNYERGVIHGSIFIFHKNLRLTSSRLAL
jgi:poly(U)-specific endoribonuclease